MFGPKFLVRQKDGAQREEEEEGGRPKKGRSNRKSDARRGRSHRSNSFRGDGCEEQEKTWTVVWGSTPQERQRRLGISPILS